MCGKGIRHIRQEAKGSGSLLVKSRMYQRRPYEQGRKSGSSSYGT